MTVEALEALDLLIWLGNGIQAGEADPGRLQPQTASSNCNLKLHRVAGAWELVGEALLLRLKRQLHQRSRFLGGQTLRLQAPPTTACFDRLISSTA